MRLIDADALDAEMYHKSFEVDDGRNVWNSGLWIRYKIFEEAIRDAPTIDAVPVRHGKWITEECLPGVAVCSNCGHEIRGIGCQYTKYCDECGARMDAE